MMDCILAVGVSGGDEFQLGLKSSNLRTTGLEGKGTTELITFRFSFGIFVFECWGSR